MVRVKKIYEQAGGKSIRALKNVNLIVKRGDFTAVMGPSGSGKTTLLHIIGFLLRPSAGKYFFEGTGCNALSEKGINVRRRKIGFIFQAFHLLPALSVRENVELPAIFAGMKRSERRKKALEILTYLGLGNNADSRVYDISRGEAQRVSIARALINSPTIVLADEPTGNVDLENKIRIMDELKRLNKEIGTTILTATHDDYVAKRCKKILQLEGGVIR
jgi:putative ABC transport system ATP-binding protein